MGIIDESKNGIPVEIPERLLYPPLDKWGVAVATLAEVDALELKEIDGNEFSRLYEDSEGNLYVYKVKNPVSPLFELIKQERDDVSEEE